MSLIETISKTIEVSMKKLAIVGIAVGVSYVISRLLSQTSLKNDVPLPNSLEELRTREVNIDEYAKDDEWVKKASRFGKKILMVQPSKKNPRKVIKACSVVELFTKITGLLPNEVFDYIQVKNALAVRDNVHFSYPLDYENRDLPVFFHHNQFVFAVKKTGQVTLYFFFANNNNGLVFYDLVRYFIRTYANFTEGERNCSRK